MGALRAIGDGLRNLVANIGTPRDKAAGSFYATPLLMTADALNAYRGAWLPRKIVDIPALDATRNWRQWQAEGEQITALESEETRLGVQLKVLDAMTKARLWGGAAVYIGTGDQDPSKPLNPETIKQGGLKHLNVLTRRILQAGEIENDAESSQYGRPRYYTIQSQLRQVQIHPSRLVVFTGAPHPDPEMATGEEHGWGDSVLLSIMEQIKQADSTSANIASLVFEAKVDVISIPNLMASLGDKSYEQKLLERLTLAATAKGINGCLILDTEETYEQKTAQFSELTNILLAFMQLVSGAADIPVTRLLGQAPAGFNATGDNDIRNYYDRIRAMQELTMTPAMALLDECLIRSALGARPPEVFYNWRSLWQTTDKERADIGKITAESIKIISETKLVPEDVMSEVAVTMLTESGIAPGLESAMTEWQAANPEGEDTDADDIASLTTDPTRTGTEVVDAKPRTLYVSRKVTNAAEIIAWAKAQGFTDITPDLHVTIAYSTTPVDWFKVGTSWSDKLDIAAGGPRQMEALGPSGEYAALLITASELVWRNKEIIEAGASWSWPDYQPHISIQKGGDFDLSKVEPYRGRIVLGPEIFEEIRED